MREGVREQRSRCLRTIGGRVSYTTEFGSLETYRKGFIELIDDDAKHYAFSNMFEVASASKPYEKVAVGKNMQYVLEVLRAEGSSEWRTASHDEFALVMDGTVVVDLVKLDNPIRPEGEPGSVAVDGEPAGKKMGRVTAGRGHMVLLPANAAYRFTSEQPGVILLQTILGPDTVERWTEICLS
jgi:quercetin dioxygenase-like cupin family protein